MTEPSVKLTNLTLLAINGKVYRLDAKGEPHLLTGIHAVQAAGLLEMMNDLHVKAPVQLHLHKRSSELAAKAPLILSSGLAYPMARDLIETLEAVSGWNHPFTTKSVQIELHLKTSTASSRLSRLHKNGFLHATPLPSGHGNSYLVSPAGHKFLLDYLDAMTKPEPKEKQV